MHIDIHIHNHGLGSADESEYPVESVEMNENTGVSHPRVEQWAPPCWMGECIVGRVGSTRQDGSSAVRASSYQATF